MGAFVGPIIAGLGALTGLFGSPSKTTSNSSTTTTPNFTAPESQLQNFLLNQYQTQVQNAPQWNKAYQTSGLQNLLNGSTQASQAANDALAARGTARTTAGAQTVANTGYQEGNQIASFLNNAPIVEQQNLSNLESGAGSFLSSIPVGTTSNSNTTTIGNGVANPVAGAISGGATSLAGILGQQSAQNSLGNILKGLGLGTNGTGSAYGPGIYAPNQAGSDNSTLTQNGSLNNSEDGYDGSF